LGNGEKSRKLHRDGEVEKAEKTTTEPSKPGGGGEKLALIANRLLMKKKSWGLEKQHPLSFSWENAEEGNVARGNAPSEKNLSFLQRS